MHSTRTLTGRQDSWQTVERMVCDNAEKKATLLTHGVGSTATRQTSLSSPTRLGAWHIREVHGTKYTWTWVRDRTKALATTWRTRYKNVYWMLGYFVKPIDGWSKMASTSTRCYDVPWKMPRDRPFCPCSFCYTIFNFVLCSMIKY